MKNKIHGLFFESFDISLGSSLAEKELFLFFSLLLHTFSFHPVPGEKVKPFLKVIFFNKKDLPFLIKISCFSYPATALRGISFINTI